MKSFETAEPIAVDIEMGIGDLQVIASDRQDTVVVVEPANPASESDVNAAAQTLVELVGHNLRIRAPKSWKQWTPWGGRESVNIRVELPAGSDLSATTGLAPLRTAGRLGDCVYKTGLGEVQVDDARSLDVKTSAGEVTVGSVQGDLVITTGSGQVLVGCVEGVAEIKSSNGDMRIGVVGGDLRATTSNGRISVDDAGAAVSAKTANGDIRLGTIRRGTTYAQTAFGKIEVGVSEGVTAWLDLDTSFGAVYNELVTVEQPEPGAETVEITVRSSMGSIAIHRSLEAITEVATA